MTPALRWTLMRAILMFHNCEGQSHKTVSTDHNFWRERRAEADSNRSPSALPLGHTGSHITGNEVLYSVRTFSLKQTRPNVAGTGSSKRPSFSSKAPSSSARATCCEWQCRGPVESMRVRKHSVINRAAWLYVIKGWKISFLYSELAVFKVHYDYYDYY